MTAFPLYDDAIRKLEGSRYPKQARKLIFAACRRRWENDESKLATVALVDLVDELLQSYPTLESLQEALEKIARKLNKKELYAEVAGEVIHAVGPLYGGDAVAAGKQLGAPSTAPDDAVEFEATQISALGAVARILEAHPQSLRMRKLLYATCYNFWENDLDKLLALDLQVLIEQAYQAYPTPLQLQERLQRVVRSLNKKDRYEPIAQTIVERVTDLYDGDALVASVPVVAAANTPDRSLAVAAEDPVPLAAEELREETRQERNVFYNTFKLRREVMKYTTPLQAKALVFSILQGKSIDPHGVDWLLLKTYNLDDLLRDLIQAHDGFDVLKESLERVARQQERVDEALQAASAIAVSVKPIYGRTEQNA